jgi:catechol 2,3-dioxygenase
MTERIQDVAHLGRLELLTPNLDRSRRYFESALGMKAASDEGRLIYLRGYGDYAASTLKLTESDHPGIGYISWRAASPEALERCVNAIQKTGLGDRWDSGDFGRGPAYRFRDPDGHHMEIYYEEQNTGRSA